MGDWGVLLEVGGGGGVGKTVVDILTFLYGHYIMSITGHLEVEM